MNGDVSPRSFAIRNQLLLKIGFTRNNIPDKCENIQVVSSACLTAHLLSASLWLSTLYQLLRLYSSDYLVI